ncbi:hypothetical protein O3M35_009664 [Rhynocoris fuscipes]|uniref:Chitin-binding type-2 domain-containing protein n=1 Tax=Rhynocoris fuscipes TaxID=488301 RepID=A0AAW1D951_9HEMI
MGPLITVLTSIALVTCVVGAGVKAPVAASKDVGAPTADTCSSVEVKCKNCTHLGVCIAIGQPEIAMPCLGAAQYCTDGACSSKPSSECSGGFSSSFSCPPTDGHYPDPNNCRLYHICVSKVAADYSCEANQVYSTNTHSCVRQTLQNTCQTVNCKQKNGQYSLYPPDHRYAFFCLSGETTGIMATCGNSQEYNTDLNKCQVKCSKEGLVPDPDDERNFIECTATGIGINNYEQVKRQCPNNDKIKSNFDPNTLECVVSTSKK